MSEEDLNNKYIYCFIIEKNEIKLVSRYFFKCSKFVRWSDDSSLSRSITRFISSSFEVIIHSTTGKYITFIKEKYILFCILQFFPLYLSLFQY